MICSISENNEKIKTAKRPAYLKGDLVSSWRGVND